MGPAVHGLARTTRVNNVAHRCSIESRQICVNQSKMDLPVEFARMLQTWIFPLICSWKRMDYGAIQICRSGRGRVMKMIFCNEPSGFGRMSLVSALVLFLLGAMPVRTGAADKVVIRGSNTVGAELVP